jgi:hypothetical protein
MPLSHLPRFKETAKFVMHATIPGQDGNEAEFDLGKKSERAADAPWKGKNVKVNPNEDVKISFAFAHKKFMIPWLSVFDSKKRRSLEKLIITFDHDQHDVLEVHYQRVYGKEIQRLDPDHPSVVGFEIEYVWRAAEDADFSSGIFEMFLMTLIFGVGLICLVLCYDPALTATRAANKTGPGKPKRISAVSGRRR